MIGKGEGKAGTISAKLLLKHAARWEVDETHEESCLNGGLIISGVHPYVRYLSHRPLLLNLR
jgi:hypothetical protein